MAVQSPYYAVATINLTNGSPNFTTVGATLQTFGIDQGAQIFAGGNSAMVASITGENAGTLANNWAPANYSGPGVIMPAAQTVVMLAAVRDLITQLASGNLSSIAGLASAANKGIYFTGSGAAALHDNNPGFRAIGALQPVGIGQFPVWTGATTAENRNIIGTVAQSGGYPTGALMEEGSNGNGRYARFASGLQVCWIDDLTCSYFNAARLEGTWTYPAAFTAGTKITVIPTWLDSTVSTAATMQDEIIGASSATAAGATACLLRLRSLNGGNDWQSGDTVHLAAIGIGRWFA